MFKVEKNVEKKKKKKLQWEIVNSSRESRSLFTKGILN